MATVLDIVVTVVSLVVVAAYTWSLRGHFSSKKMPDGAKVISLFVTATTVFFLYLMWWKPQLVWAQLAGLLLELAAAALFWWAITASRKARLRFAFDHENPDSLVMTGPYRYLRHPFYTSYIVFWTGWGLATSSIWSIVPVAFFVAIYVAAARNEERKFSSTPLAHEYEAYRRRTGFLWPRFVQAK
jgi:protein-S-isoprenylcysteine O-methyltransferase Ste14